MRPLTLLSIAFLTLLLSACNEQHPAQGSWKGMLSTNGQQFDMGKVVIGADYIEIPEIEQRYEALSFTSSSNETFFGRKRGGNVQAQGDNMLAGTSGSIKFLNERKARMTINELQGIITLTR